MIPMMTGKIDLTVGYGIVLWHILAITLQIHAGLPWPVAVVLVILAGAAFGWFNGLLVEVARIDSFIATLGTGTVIYAVALWYTGGRQMIGNLPPVLLPGEQRQHLRHADHRVLRAGDLAAAVDRAPSICRSAATSTPSAPTRAPPSSTASRPAAT